MATPTLLYVTQVAPYRDGPAGVHGVLDQSSTAVAQLAEAAGMAFHRVADVRALDDGVLAAARVVALFTIGETPWSPEQQTTILDGLRAGRTSVLAIHSATDSCYGWSDYGRVVGARFDGHPWTQWCTLDVVDPTHPAVAHLGPTWRWYDEVYQFRDLRPDAQVLLAARPDELGADSGSGGAPEAGGAGHGVDHPLSWCFTEGAGRVFSTSLGHFPSAWENPGYLRHLAGGLGWLIDAGPRA
jgi:type 1 glutamine amidotransferase